MEIVMDTFHGVINLVGGDKKDRVRLGKLTDKLHCMGLSFKLSVSHQGVLCAEIPNGTFLALIDYMIED